ncbi:MAG: outer membrane lipoprotein LolB [Candidatus Parabeggiatoa sp. nov. 3]|nr:MAG: outer membrane lipoprotein LolB [Gammaproteobacteria bacterium]RKZ69006.1 MAG: outer membrane lipoprotein LolB [Gammaproteobacteria bacterium]RKZ89024.1 MAG: outer membrane lipoprotein LolB [Gammaproteobacteria bacterium]
MKRFLLILVVFLSACVSLPKLPPLPASQLDAWRLKGRIAISSDSENWTASVYWQQQGSTYQLRLNMPLGQGALLLEGDEKEVIMRTADNKTYKAANADALMADVLKLDMPVTDLRFWIRGIPAPQSAPDRYLLNDKKQLRHLQQDGWFITYLHYVNVEGIALPKKMFLENQSIKVKIAILEWAINPAKHAGYDQ